MMKVTFYSNFLNHHQLPFCLSMYKRLGGNFTFVATEQIPQERIDLGYEDMNSSYPFVLKAYDNKENHLKALRLSEESDAIIAGSCPEDYVSNRILSNRLTFRYSERIYKNGLWRALSPRGAFHMVRKHTANNNRPLYMLCASAYTAYDFSLFGAYKGKTYKWGYFPEVIDHNIGKLIESKEKDIPQILWCGRLIDFKHPEKAIDVAKKLRDEGISFKLDIIGTGLKYEEIRKLIIKNDLSNNVKLLGSMSPSEVRNHMENADIYLFTSDYQEGWGAVLNEAMNSGCAIIASHAIGSVPFLIENGVNGLIYKNDSNDDLFQLSKKLINDKALRMKLGEKAYYTVKNTWNADQAVTNFLRLVESIGTGAEATISEGPCSFANTIPQRSMYKKIMSIKERKSI